MSTNINITVGDNALLDRAKQQQTANRQAQLNRENSTRLEAQATDERTKAQAASGKDANGNPLYGVPIPTPQIDRRPAANRFGQGLDLGCLWITDGPGTSRSQVGIVPQFNGSNLLDANIAGSSELRFAVGSGAPWTYILHSNYEHPAFPTDPGEDTSPSIVVKTRNVRSRRDQAQRNLAFALPAGRGNFIFVFCDASAWNGIDAEIYHAFGATAFPSAPYSLNFGETPIGYTSASSYTFSQTTNRVYICNNFAYRQITPSETFQAVLELLNPPAVVSSFTANINGQPFTRTDSLLGFPPAGTGYVLRDNDEGFSSILESDTGITYTPSVFEELQTYYEFVSSEAIKPYPTKLKWGFLDESEGAYLNAPTFADAYQSAKPLYHALWGNANEYPDRRVWDPEFAYLNLPPPKRINKATIPVNARPSNEEYNVELLTVWDWDDPAYCRSMCTALGFSSADLTP